MKSHLLKVIAIMMAGAFSTISQATLINGSSLQNVINGITVGGVSDINVHTDQLEDSADTAFGLTSSGGSMSTIVAELAGAASTNEFGVYDLSDSSKKVRLFYGAASAGNRSLFSLGLDGSVFVNFVDTGIDFAANRFGFYLNALGEGKTYYSDTSLNTDGVDHMVAYEGTGNTVIQLPGLMPGTWTSNEYILGFEDWYTGVDRDYEDFVVMVGAVKSLPTPSALLMFMLGLAGLGAVRQRGV